MHYAIRHNDVFASLPAYPHEFHFSRFLLALPFLLSHRIVFISNRLICYCLPIKQENANSLVKWIQILFQVAIRSRDLSFVLTYIHNLYARAHYMFEVYLDFTHIYAHWNFHHVRIFLQFDFPPASIFMQTIARRRERKKISLKCKLESIGLRFITAIIAICFWHFNYFPGSFTPFTFYFIFLLWLF